MSHSISSHIYHHALPMWICEELAYRNVSKHFGIQTCFTHIHIYTSLWTHKTHNIIEAYTHNYNIYTAYIYISCSQIFRQSHLECNIVAYFLDPWSLWLFLILNEPNNMPRTSMCSRTHSARALGAYRRSLALNWLPLRWANPWQNSDFLSQNQWCLVSMSQSDLAISSVVFVWTNLNGWKLAVDSQSTLDLHGRGPQSQIMEPDHKLSLGPFSCCKSSVTVVERG